MPRSHFGSGLGSQFWFSPRGRDSAGLSRNTGSQQPQFSVLGHLRTGSEGRFWTTGREPGPGPTCHPTFGATETALPPFQGTKTGYNSLRKASGCLQQSGRDCSDRDHLSIASPWEARGSGSSVAFIQFPQGFDALLEAEEGEIVNSGFGHSAAT